MVNSKEKGSEFERLTGRKLSLWVSAGARADLFARNVLSGGSFTNAMKKASNEHGMPGDLTANHPLAFTFLSRYMVECKHYADLGFEAFLFDTSMDKSFLGRVWTKSRKEARDASKSSRKLMHAMVIARQNRRPPILLVDTYISELLAEASPKRLAAPHVWHLPQSTCMYLFEDVMARISAAAFLQLTEHYAKEVE